MMVNTIDGIDVLSNEDLMKIATGKMHRSAVNIFAYDNDMRYLILQVGAIRNFIDVETGHVKQMGIFIDEEDLKTFIHMDMLEKAVFFANALGDKFHGGYGLFVGTDELGLPVYKLVDKYMDMTNNKFWFAYDKYEFYRMTYEDMACFISTGGIFGERVEFGSFFGSVV